MLGVARWLAAFLFFVLASASIAQANAQPIVIQLKWLHQFQSAGIYAALEQGYFAEEGLDVVLRERDPAKNIVSEVLDGPADYGVADSILLMHHAAGDPVVLVAAFLQHSAGALMTMTSSGLTAPADLIGKRVAFYDNDSDGIDVLALLAEQRVLNKGLIRVAWDERLRRLAAGEIDAVAVYLTNEPYVMNERGYQVNLISPRHFGIDLYGDMLFTSRAEAEGNPERVEAVRRAVIRGWHYALDHKEEMVELIYRRYNTQNKSREALMNEARGIETLIDRYTTPLGQINPKRVAFLYDKLRSLDLVSAHGSAPLGLVFKAGSGLDNLDLTTEERQFVASLQAVRFAVDEAGWPPFEFYGAQGQLQGIVSDYLEVLSKRLGVRFERISTSSWSEVLEGVKARTIDMLPSAASTPDRRNYMGFTDTYLTSPMVIVTRDNVDYISSLSQLEGQRVGVVGGYASDETLSRYYPGLTLTRYPSSLDGLRRLAAGEVDAFVDNLAASIHIIKMQGLANLKISGQTPYTFDLAMGVRSDWPLLRNAIDKVLAGMTPQEHTAIYDRWVKLSVSSPFPWGRILPWAGALTLAVLIMLVYSMRMRVLNRRIRLTNASLLEAEQALREKNQQLQEASVRDKLTGVFNRYHLDAMLFKEFERYQRYHRPFSIVMFDLDHFKQVNDKFGHQAGDEVLRRFCEIVLKNIRQSDTFGRWGGEEFMLICPDTVAKDAFIVADKVRAALAGATLYDGLVQTVSGGIRDSVGCGSIDQQISGADNNLYQAKSAGRNRIVFDLG